MHRILSTVLGMLASAVAVTPNLTWPGIIATIIYAIIGGAFGVGTNYFIHWLIKKFKHAKV